MGNGREHDMEQHIEELRARTGELSNEELSEELDLIVSIIRNDPDVQRAMAKQDYTEMIKCACETYNETDINDDDEEI